MAIDKNLENKFLDMVNNKDTSSKSNTVYGTVTSVDATDSDYRVTVRIDGSDRNITLQTTTACKNDDRVIVQIKDHSAIIIGKVIPDIVASKVTAGEMNITDISELGKVDDLNKLSGKISGIHLNPAAMYSGDKNALTSNSQGLYLGADGQISIGDANNYLTFFKTDSGEWKLMVSASTISFGGGTDLATAINNANTAAGNAYSYAGSAYSKASTANDTANTANNTANAANNTANAANDTANAANNTANAANDTANKAKDAANEAAKTATNYLSYDSTNGLLIRQSNATSSLGTSESNVQLTSTEFNIRKGTKTYLNVTSTGIKIYTDSQTKPIAEYGDGYMKINRYTEGGVGSEVHISPSHIHMLDGDIGAMMTIDTWIYSVDTGGTIPAVQITSDQIEMRAVTNRSTYASTGVSSYDNTAWVRATDGSQNTRVGVSSDAAYMYYSGGGQVRVYSSGAYMESYSGGPHVILNSDTAELSAGGPRVTLNSGTADLSAGGSHVKVQSSDVTLSYTSNQYTQINGSCWKAVMSGYSRFEIYNGNVYCNARLQMQGNSIVNQSDRRMKTDFIDASKWDEFYDRLNPCGFKYKNLDNGYHIGFIAQDVEQALTDSGLTKEDFSGLTINPYHKMGDEKSDIQDGEDVYNLAYTEFIALNTHEIQKLKTKVSTLESRIEALENLLTNL